MKGDLEQLFREADVDKNNYLTLTELCAAMRRCGYTGDDSVVKVSYYSVYRVGCLYKVSLHISYIVRFDKFC